MKMRMKHLAIAAGLLALTSVASATVVGNRDGDVGACAIQANLRIQSLHLVLGGSYGVGRGDIVCSYVDGHREMIPVIVRTSGVGIGAGVSSTEAVLFSAGIGVLRSGHSLLGSYAMAKASAQAVVIGADVGLSFTAKRSGLSIPIDLKLKAGPGLELAADIGKMTIELDRSRLD